MANPTLVTVVNLAAYTPAETIELVSRAGVAKGNMRPDKIFLSAVSAGCLLAFASGMSNICNTAPWYQENAPGVIRIISALLFPFGFVIITLTGADVFISTTMYTTVAALHQRLSVWKLAMHWFLCFWGNLAGSLFVTIVIIGYGGILSSSPYKEQVIASMEHRQLAPEWHQIFLRGIGCNWLVCLSAFMAMQAKGLGSKVVGMWFPIFGFVALGLDHVVANMSLVPMGIFLGTPGLTTGLYIWKGIIPAGLGNIIGGALMVGTYYWWMHLFMQDPVPVDGVFFTQPTPRSSWGFRLKGVAESDEERGHSSSSGPSKDERTV